MAVDGPYNHSDIEKRWQKRWEEEALYRTEDSTSGKPKMYILDMFPYPSGTGLHVGHPRGYIASDVFARYKRMQGYNVLHPMGFDSFGLPAEQHAIKTGNHPGPYTDELVAHYKRQLENIGFSYDWSREVATHKPEYYKWTQWIFLKLFNSWYNKETNKTEPIETCIEKLQKEDSLWEGYSEKEKQDILMGYRIAYEGYAEVNWCPELGTVLANDEVVTAPDGTMVSERGEHPVIRKSMRQWFMRISAYADRLLSGLDAIDWPHGIKEIQRNWIGKSEGSELSFEIKDTDKKITVFTTRADTLFGVTYVVLAPEHTLVQELLSKVTNRDEVEAYITKTKATSEDDRINDKNEKTGVCLEGVSAINPANGEEVPVWIANYVLASYGTGAVMAVPAHDERDFEFAKKYNLEIKEVVASFYQLEGESALKENVETVSKNIVVAIIENTKGEFLILKESSPVVTDFTFIGGGVENEESQIDALKREIVEETGYVDFDVLEKIPVSFFVEGYRHTKGNNQKSFGCCFHVKLKSENRVKSEVEEGKHSLIWLKKEEIEKKLTWPQHLAAWKIFLKNIKIFTEDGFLINSKQFDGFFSEEAKKKITEFVGGRLVTKYKMRDAIFARQRYWGEPIPLRHSTEGIISALSEEELPLTLPDLQDFAPAGDGNSALSKSKEWMDKGYETNTMPGWAGSSWYFLRYMDPHNTKAFASPEAVKYWGQVDMYVGGAEHATGHLLYSRFWNMALHDLGYVPQAEPFAALRNQGMIAGPDGRKMSKRWGNVINPDDVVAQLGADTLRVYESFMGPFESHLPWSTDGIVGSRRFIERVYRVVQNGKVGTVTDEALQKLLHKTIKKVSEDINVFAFNTAVSAMMIFLNDLEKSSSIAQDDFLSFLKLLAPFAPYLSEELWSQYGQSGSVHRALWPVYDPTKIVDDEVTLGIQINGKLRAEITVGAEVPDEEIESRVLAIARVQECLAGEKPKKIIVVRGRVVNIVV